MYKIELESRAKRELFKLQRDVIDLLSQVIHDLSNDPRPSGSKKLSGVDGYRVRKGNYRILYTIDDSAKLVRIFRLGHRRDIYRKR